MDGMLSAYGRGGTPRWSFSTQGSPVESSPLVVDGRVYVGAWNGTLYAVDADTGKADWTFQAAADIKGSAGAGRQPDRGRRTTRATCTPSTPPPAPSAGASRGGQRFYGGPAVSGGTLVIGDVGGAVIALDARTGRQLWRHATSGYVYSTPAIAKGTVFVGSYSGTLRGARPRRRVREVVLRRRASGSRDPPPSWGTWSTPRSSRSRGRRAKTFGLDTASGKVLFTGDDGRYSPAVGAGVTLYLVGTRVIDAYRDPTP